MRTRTAFLAGLPRKRVTAGALIRDESGRVLLVEPVDKDEWLTPGGSVEAGESPARGASREVLEELGVAIRVGRALVMQWLQEEDDPDGVLHFAYDGGVVDAATIARFRLPPDELRSFRFIDPPAVPSMASSVTSARVAAAIEAVATGAFIELAE